MSRNVTKPVSARQQLANRCDYLRDELGFDQSTLTGGAIRVRCSQCAAAAINGVACHETGCPNATKECKGCNARVPARLAITYCGSCLVDMNGGWNDDDDTDGYGEACTCDECERDGVRRRFCVNRVGA